MSIRPFSENDAREIELFKSYLAALHKWERENDRLPDFAPSSDLEIATYRKAHLKASVEIYEQIYGSKP